MSSSEALHDVKLGPDAWDGGARIGIACSGRTGPTSQGKESSLLCSFLQAPSDFQSLRDSSNPRVEAVWPTFLMEWSSEVGFALWMFLVLPSPI